VADGYVHPAHYGQGIGTTLIELTEARATELIPTMPERIRLVLVNNIIASSEAARTLFETHGYTLKRVYFQMHITLDKPPQPPSWPEGISMRVCNGSEEDIRRAYATIEESFQDHWAHTPVSFEEWRRWMVREEFDSTLWFFAQDNGEIVGATLCRVHEAGHGWIIQVGVRRPWRKRGLAEALLRQAFSTFYQRGITRVGLGVDAQSLTGAQRLYERVGMHVTMRIGRYEKELRPGKDLQEEQ
jgi:ribosomal protein S18 acetylase RimI-like enzyme